MRRLRTAKGRRSARQSIAEGPHALASLISASTRIEYILATADDVSSADVASRHGIDLLTISPDVLASVSDTKTPQGPIAVFSIPSDAPLRRHDQVVLHDVADPGNVGTIIRTAVAFGWDVTLSGVTADPWNPKVVRASAGTVFRAHIAHLEDLTTLHSMGVSTVATVVDAGDIPTRSNDDPVAILIGSEAGGLPTPMAAEADVRWTIPMKPGTESLNAAVAAGILMYTCSIGPSVGVSDDL